MLSDLNIRNTAPNSDEGLYQIYENLDVYVGAILKNLHIIPISISKLGGEGGANLKIHTAAKSYVLKITPYPGILQVAEYFYRRAKEINIPVPEVYNLDRTKLIIPFEYMLIEFLQGKLPNELPANQHSTAGEIVGRNIHKAHSIIVTDFNEYIASYTKWDYSKWLNRLDYYLQVPQEEVQQLGLNSADVRFIKSLVSNPDLLITEPHLLHGDLHSENCLFLQKDSNLELTGLIDPNTAFGDPMLDLAIAEVLSVKWESYEFYVGLMRGYGELSVKEQKRKQILRILYAYWLPSMQSYENKDISLLKVKLISYLGVLR